MNELQPIVCERCGRNKEPWPLKRPGNCSPKHWVNCIAPYTESELLAHPVIGAQMRAADERWESGDRSTISYDEFRALVEEATYDRGR